MEIAADERRRTRKMGFDKMHERDQAWRRLSNGTTMLWHVPKDRHPIGLLGPVMPNVPEDKFALVINGKEILFDTEEFRKWLRWA